MITEPVVFKNGKGQRLAGRIHRAETVSRRGVIFSHGLFSSKDGYKITSLAKDIVGAGYTLLTYDFSFVGESEGDISLLSVLQEVNDLECAVRFFLDYGMDSVHLMGSSMGGAVTLLHAAAHPESIGSLVLIATPVDLESLIIDNTDIRDVDALPDDGMTDLQGFLITNRFFKEIRKVDVRNAVEHIAVPALIIHGGEDVVVDAANASYVSSHLAGEHELVIIDDGDHHLTRKGDMDCIRDNALRWFRKWDRD